MTKTSVLIVSTSENLIASLKEKLLADGRYSYELLIIPSVQEEIPPTDICLLDADSLPENGIDFLAQANFQLAPRPLVFLMNQDPIDEEEFKAVKSLTADFLIKERISSSSLHNTIRYALENNRLKMEIEQQQIRYSSLFYNSVEPAVFLDTNFNITGVNDAFLEAFDKTSSEVVGSSFLSFTRSDRDREKMRNMLENLESGKLDVNFNFSSTNHKFLAHLIISPIIESQLIEAELKNEIVAYHGTLTNISHLERLRAMRQKSEKVAMTYRLARTMAHEIRNPLTNINLANDQLKEELKGDENLEMYFGIIDRCTERIDGLLKNLLRSSEKQVFKRTTFDFVELYREVVKAIADRSQLLKIKLNSKIEISEAVIEGDREKLRIALTNLFTNAIESMDKEEKIINCGLHKDTQYIYAYVEDNGCGMDEEQQETLFDPFFTSKRNGVGLGLTSTQTIVTEHDGHIQVESIKGSGSTFTIFLPIHQVQMRVEEALS